jgi:hypothetical protein
MTENFANFYITENECNLCGNLKFTLFRVKSDKL